VRSAERPAGDRARDWASVSIALVALGVALGGLHLVLVGAQWWLVGMVMAAVILISGAIVRSLARHRLWGVVAQVLVGAAVLTAMHAPREALLGVIPTQAAFDRFGELVATGGAAIASQGIPAQAGEGIRFLVALGVGALALALDLFVSGARMPVLAGLPLLVLLLVPTTVDPQLHDPLTFVFTALAYLALLLVGNGGARRVAVAVGAAAVVLALAVPPLLPPVQAPTSTGAGGGSSLNPLISLGDDLRRTDPVIAYTYRSETPQYFRLTVLDDFGGVTWSPDTATVGTEGIDRIGPVPGLDDNVPTTTVTSAVTVGDVRSAWLPLPYAPRAVSGLEGRWRWDPRSLAVRGDGANARGQVFEVSSLTISPSIEQLVEAGTRVPTSYQHYTVLPSDLPPVVAETAELIAGSAGSNYEAAIALQSWFRSGDFVYSERAPVQQGYDGGGASVLDDFLAAKAGYCVHFASAMAAMARTLDIPARIAVGFTQGTPIVQGGETVYRVTTHDFHAWPELFFDGIGWVRFEPTPGRGDIPAFAPAVADDPATPDVDESVPASPVQAPTPDPQGSGAPVAEGEGVDEEPADESAATAASVPPIGWIVVAALAALLVLPAALRIVVRELRMSRVAHGSASSAWAELRATVHDLGRPLPDALTPRQVADDLAFRISGSALPALERLTASIEHEAYARDARPPSVRDVRLVRRALSRRAGVVSRVLAVAAPRSLFARLSPAGSERSPVAW